MINFLKSRSHLFSIFITGAIVLVIEVTAVRILAPYFGSTIFTVSSVITVILTALALGYTTGGRLADKHPSSFLFYLIIFLSGLVVSIMQILINTALPSAGQKLGFISGPLIVSLVLFFLPAFLLGMLSPFAIKLQSLKTKKVKVGKISGDIFFASTLGSILGSLVTGFVLIPRLGLNAIILGSSLVLLLVGAGGIYKNFFKNIILTLLLALAIVLVFLNLFIVKKPSFEGALFVGDGVYEKIVVFDKLRDNKMARYLVQNNSSSSAIYLDTDELVFDYTKHYILYKLIKDNLQKALVIGGGNFSVPRQLLKNEPRAVIDAVEIEPKLFDVSQKYFGLQPDPRLNIFIEDGRRFLAQTEKKYAFIFLDAYSSLYSLPTHMTTLEFFESLKSALSQDGVVVANVIGSLKAQKHSFLLSEIRTFQLVFPNSYFFAMASPNTKERQNIIFLGLNSKKSLDFEKVRKDYPEHEIFSALSQKLIEIDENLLSKYPLLTDDYAPIEFLVGQTIKDS